MVRVKAVREKSGDRILPAIYSDNYVALMPGERRTIRTELEEADTRGERPRMVVEDSTFNKAQLCDFARSRYFWHFWRWDSAMPSAVRRPRQERIPTK